MTMKRNSNTELTLTAVYLKKNVSEEQVIALQLNYKKINIFFVHSLYITQAR